MGPKRTVLSGVREFRKSLSKELPVKRIIIFGSAATGKMREGSDVDLIIISPKFKGKKSRMRALGFYRHWKLDMPYDFLCFTPEEVRGMKKGINIVSEAFKHGVEV